jgi:hypothetical protein
MSSSKEYYIKNRERIIRTNTEYNKKNKQKIKEYKKIYDKKYYRMNRQKILDKNKEYQKKKKREYYQKNKQKWKNRHNKLKEELSKKHMSVREYRRLRNLELGKQTKNVISNDKPIKNIDRSDVDRIIITFD